MKKKLSLKDARCIEDICLLKHDSKVLGNYWLIADGYEVTILNQPKGQLPIAKISIPRKTFNKMIAFYEKKQAIKSKKS